MCVDLVKSGNCTSVHFLRQELRMLTALKITAVTGCLALISLFVAVKQAVPNQIHDRLIQAIKSECLDCKVTIGNVELSFFPRVVTLNDIHLYLEKRGDVVVNASLKKLVATISLRPLLSHLINFQHITFTQPEVLLTEYDGHSKNRPDDHGPESIWNFRVAGAHITDGKFTYHREHAGKVASIRVKQINGNIDELGSTTELRDKLASGHIAAVLENSGIVDLTVSPMLFSKSIHVNIELGVNELKLDEVNAFFNPGYGVVLTGFLKMGRSSILVRGENLHGWVRAQYDHLSVKFKKTKERGGISAFFSTIASSMKVDHKNTTSKKSDQIRTIEIARTPGEVLIPFIFRGMKEAALKVATD